MWASAPGWRRWLDAAGVEGVDAEAGPGFNDAGLVLLAAVPGQGVALGRLTLASNDFSCWLVPPRPLSGRRDVAAFKAWLLAEARAAA